MIERRQLEYNSAEPRIGIPIFAGEISEEIVEDKVYKRIVTADISLGTLGNGLIYLGKPQSGQLEEQISQDDQAFTIDLSGETHTGKLRDFLNTGYYMMKIGIINIIETRQQLDINVWIDQKEPIFSSNIKHTGIASTSDFSRTTEGVRQSFVLPHNLTILKALRINVATNE